VKAQTALMSFRTKLLLWLLLAVLFASLIGSVNVPRLYQLNEHGISAEAIVTAITPENHNSFLYAYTVAGTRYTGAGFIHELPKAEVGEKVSVRYLPEAPDVSCSGDVRAALINELISVGMVVLVFPPLIIWRISSVLRKCRQICDARHLDRRWAWLALFLGPFAPVLISALDVSSDLKHNRFVGPNAQSHQFQFS
jgi:hypothetical protein